MAQVERACDIGRRDAQGEGAVLRVWNPVLERETRKLMQIMHNKIPHQSYCNVNTEDL